MNKVNKFLYVISCIFIPLYSLGVTNELWLKSIPLSDLDFTGLTSNEAFSLLEKESRKVCPLSNGIRIIPCKPFPNSHEKIVVQYRFKSETILNLLEMYTKLTECGYTILDDVAIITRRNFRYMPMVIYGKCVNAISKEPITDFLIESKNSKPVLSVEKDGSFICGIPCRLDFNMNDYYVVNNINIFQKKQTFTVNASGFKKRFYQKNIFESESSRCCHLNIELFPTEKRGTSGGQANSGSTLRQIRGQPLK